MTKIQVVLVVFLTVLMLINLLLGFANKDKEEIARRVRMVTGDGGTDKKREAEKVKNKPLAGLTELFRLFTPQRILRKLETDLIQADLPLKGEEMVLVNLASTILFAILAQLILGNVISSMLFAIGGAYLPLIFIKTAKAKRLKKFDEQLSDALTIMTNSLRAGLSFLQTMDSLQREMAPPISVEFGRALREMRLGTTTEEALRNMVERIKSEDLELIVTAVNIQRQVGGNLAEVLDNISATINERLRIRGELKTLTAQGRISGVIVALLPIILAGGISVINPAYIALLFSHPLGLLLITSAVISELIGILTIKKIVNIDV
ncbi:MAG: type II secretion system F family protein [Dethiobacter sp.]|nr:type II secretion system F family protein [Dethiobacter sp.]MBS3990046.1 type II secretion system F family protein [Dethiobacter sp.]